VALVAHSSSAGCPSLRSCASVVNDQRWFVDEKTRALAAPPPTRVSSFRESNDPLREQCKWVPARALGEVPEDVCSDTAWGTSSVAEGHGANDQGSKFLPSTASRRASRAIRRADPTRAIWLAILLIWMVGTCWGQRSGRCWGLRERLNDSVPSTLRAGKGRAGGGWVAAPDDSDRECSEGAGNVVRRTRRHFLQRNTSSKLVCGSFSNVGGHFCDVYYTSPKKKLVNTCALLG
jgi:hypothetical protein